MRSKAGTSLTWRQPLGDPDKPFAYRWILPLGPLGSLRLHKWLCSDDMRAAHDHPSHFLTIVLKGSYDDLIQQPDGLCSVDELKQGSIRFRKATHIHRVRINDPGTWTLLWFSPPVRDWGFYKPRFIGGFRFIRQHKWFKMSGTHICD